MFQITPDNAALLVVDVQERFLGAIPSLAAEGTVGRTLRILVEGCRLLGVPTVMTEQYPKGLGPTLPHVSAANPEAPRPAKTHFSCCDDEAIAARIQGLGRSHLVLAGVEAHVCVLATAADCIARGLRVVVAADAVDSRSPEHRHLAIDALRDLGALCVPVESILFRLQRQAGVGAFKAISGLVK